MPNKALLHDVFTQTLATITPDALITQQCRFEKNLLHVNNTAYDLSLYKRVVLLGSGKAVAPMAEALHVMLKERIDSTLLIGPYEYRPIAPHIRYLQSSHPLPSQASLDAAAQLIQTLQTLESDDLFIYLLSGGNSALVELPDNGISLEDFETATALMLKGGMPIEAINCVRKHLSQVKGGTLAQLTKAKGVVLVLSDVIGDDLHAIGSAPFYFDTTTFDDAIAQLKTYKLFEKMPQSIQEHLLEGAKGKRHETPKRENPNITHHVLGSNVRVQEIAQTLLEAKGVCTKRIKTPIDGDTASVVRRLLEIVNAHSGERCCYILGGESTVTVSGEGKGGRNQHLCLSMLERLDGSKNVIFLSAATDGIDGNSKAAGALIDQHSRINAMSHQLDPKHYLQTFDSNTFFAATGELLAPGATHNNLLDLVLMLVDNHP